MDFTTQEPELETQGLKDPPQDTEKSSRQGLPVYTLQESIVFCAKIYTELGVGAYHSKDLIAKVHDVVYPSIKQKLSTAQYYNLLEIKHGIGYKLTNQFLKIYKPENDREKLEGTIESLRQPEIYSKLIDEFNGHPLPSEQGLSARLLRAFGIKEYAATKAAQIFLYNLRTSGLIDSNGVLKINGSVTSAKDAGGNGNGAGSTGGGTPPPSKNDPPLPGYIEIPIPLPSGNRAYLKIPENYKPEDCDRIAKFVEALK